MLRSCHPLQVYKQVLRALGNAAEPMLGQIVGALGVMFSTDPQGCMEVLTAAVDLARDAPAVQQPLGTTVNTISNSLLPVLQASPLAATFANGLRALDPLMIKASSMFILLDPVCLQQQGDSFDPDLAAACFSLLAHCLVDDAAGKMEALVLQVSPLLPGLVGLAASCLQRQEEDLVRALLAFLRNALVCPGKVDEQTALG